MANGDDLCVSVKLPHRAWDPDPPVRSMAMTNCIKDMRPVPQPRFKHSKRPKTSEIPVKIMENPVLPYLLHPARPAPGVLPGSSWVPPTFFVHAISPGSGLSGMRNKTWLQCDKRNKKPSVHHQKHPQLGGCYMLYMFLLGLPHE